MLEYSTGSLTFAQFVDCVRGKNNTFMQIKILVFKNTKVLEVAQ